MTGGLSAAAAGIATTATASVVRAIGILTVP